METDSANAEPTAPPVQPVRPARGLCCSCGSTRWRVLHTRAGVGGLLRERQCRGCGLVLLTREVVCSVPPAA
jgi:hypothetical protein